MSDEEKDKSASGPPKEESSEPKPSDAPTTTPATPAAGETVAPLGKTDAGTPIAAGAPTPPPATRPSPASPPTEGGEAGERPARPPRPAAPAAAGGEGETPTPTPRPRPAAAAPSGAAAEGGAPAAARPAPAPRAPAGPSPAELAQRAEVPSVPLDRLRARFPEIASGATFFAGVPIVPVPAGSILEVCRFLKTDPDSRCNYLSNLHGTHNPDKKDKPLEVVYNLYSIDHAQWIELKVELAEGEEVSSVTGVWKTANWHEREAFDMLGIRFAGHPDLTRILLPDDWRGHPLRKEYPLEGNPGDHGYWR